MEGLMQDGITIHTFSPFAMKTGQLDHTIYTIEDHIIGPSASCADILDVEGGAVAAAVAAADADGVLLALAQTVLRLECAYTLSYVLLASAALSTK